MTDREQRQSANEATGREINEGIESSLKAKDGYVRMLCECGHSSCESLIAIAIAEYEQVRSNPRHFAIVKGHLIPAFEFVVRETDRFVVVEKRQGDPAEVAEALDPRG